tara:strand:- start:385 stop:1077 length:693 start_codon:yes stop_codon:yes gene_type:complete
MALPTRYGSAFLAGTKGATFAQGFDFATSGVVDGGTVIQGGAIVAGDPITNDLGINTIADKVSDSHGSKIVTNDGTGAATTDRVGVEKALSGGTLAFNASATQWVMQGGNVTSTLSGASNDILRGGARDFNGDINDEANEVARTKIKDRLIGSKADEAFDITARPSTQIVPGRTKGSNAGNATTLVNPADGSAAVASEIAASRSVPGELVYRTGAANPVQDDYKAKNANE